MSSAPRGPPRWAARTSCRRRTSAKPERSQFAEGARDVRAVRQAADNRVERRVRRIRLGKAGESEAVPELSVEVLRRSEEHTSELQSLMRISYAVFCLKKKIAIHTRHNRTHPSQQSYNSTTEHSQSSIHIRTPNHAPHR